MNTLGLPESNHSKLYRAIVQALQADDTLSDLIKRWATWNDQGDPEPWASPADADLPSLGVIPWQGPDQWDGPEGFTGPLYLDLYVTVAGANAEDAFDLYAHVRRVLTSRPAQDALVALDAGYRGYGLLRLSAPQFAPMDAAGSSGSELRRLSAFGRIELPVDTFIEHT